MDKYYWSKLKRLNPKVMWPVKMVDMNDGTVFCKADTV